MSRDESTLDDTLEKFVGNHPKGWGHGEWERLLAELKDRGVDTTDEVAIGASLERARLLARLERLPVKGLGPRRREKIAERYGRLWDLRQASAEEIAASSGTPRRVAEELVAAIGE